MGDLKSSLLISLQVSLLATLVAATIGLPLAWALSRRGWRGRTAVDIAVNLPLALPPTVVGYYLLRLLGRYGPVGWLSERALGASLIFTPTAAVLAAAILCLPLFVQSVRNAIEAVPGEIYEAAQIDGATRLQAVRLVFMPLARAGIWTGAVLAYARSLGEFGATLMVAGNIPGKTQTLSLAIYAAVQSGNEPRAQQIALLLTAVAAAAIWVGLRWRSSPAA